MPTSHIFLRSDSAYKLQNYFIISARGNMISFDAWATLPALMKEILIRFLGITSSYKKT